VPGKLEEKEAEFFSTTGLEVIGNRFSRVLDFSFEIRSLARYLTVFLMEH